MGAPVLKKSKYFLLEVKTGKETPVSDTLTIGRLQGDLCFPEDEKISKTHCKLSLVPRGVVIQDLGSTNGTRVNGQPAAKTELLLKVGDKISFGRTILELRENAPFEELPIQTPQSTQQPQLSVKDMPKFVVDIPFGTVRNINGMPQDISNGVDYLLRDVQVDPDTWIYFIRRAVHVLSKAAIQAQSLIQYEFRPDWESLCVHRIGIWRKGKYLDRLELSSFRVIQREQALEQNIYDGKLTAVLSLADVQEGDIIETAVSFEGKNPIFENHFFDMQQMQFAVPLRKLHYRIVSRNKNLRAREYLPQLQNREMRNSGELVWHFDNLTAANFEPGSPFWYQWTSEVQISDFSQWSEVVQWAQKLISNLGESSPEIIEFIETLKKQSGSKEVLFRKIVQFVQENVRYLAVSDGPHSHRPHQVHEIFARKFGDCKDKSILLSHLLSLVGIECDFALVNTFVGSRLPNLLPSPSAFNHAICRVKWNGIEIWVDPSNRFYPGPVSEWGNAPFAWALIIKNGETELTKIPERNFKSQIRSEEYYQIKSFEKPALLTVTTTFSGSSALSFREAVANNSRDKLSGFLLAEYAVIYPEISCTSPLEITDNLEKNQIITKANYLIPNFV